jgi:hypothetical protein
VNTLTNIAYRLTPRGQSLLARGMERPDDAPPFFVGGCQAYSRRHPWVRRVLGDEWTIEVGD